MGGSQSMEFARTLPNVMVAGSKGADMVGGDRGGDAVLVQETDR